MIRISFPSMGESKYAFRALFSSIPDIDLIFPPPITKNIVELGIKYSPEFVCFPFKVTLGEFINLIENYHVNIFFMGIDCGPCRFGFYAPVQERILRDLGYEVTIIPLQQADLINFQWIKAFYLLALLTKRKIELFPLIRAMRLFLLKAKYIEKILQIQALLKCRELNRGGIEIVSQQLFNILDSFTDTKKFDDFLTFIYAKFRQCPIDRNKQPMRIMISGEIHVFLEKFVNMDIIKKFGQEGIEVHLGHSLYDWVIHKMRINLNRKKLENYANKYIPMDIGGEAVWVMGEYIKCQKDGFDGFVHIYPFTCMPEISCRSIIEGQMRKTFHLPIQFYSFDESTGSEGMRTRMESFIDLIKLNQQNKIAIQTLYIEPLIIKEIYDKNKPLKKTLYNRVGIYRILFKEIHLRDLLLAPKYISYYNSMLISEKNHFSLKRRK